MGSAPLAARGVAMEGQTMTVFGRHPAAPRVLILEPSTTRSIASAPRTSAYDDRAVAVAVRNALKAATAS